jgi:small subunit ribosomal protein S21
VAAAWAAWTSNRLRTTTARARPGLLGKLTINRWIEEERRVQVFVRDSNVDQALKVLKKKMQREGLFREMRLRGHYEKPSEKKTREKAEAIRRARKKMQRNGLLPMKPRLVPGALGRGGPARPPPLIEASDSRSLSKDGPQHRPIEHSGVVVATPILYGLHHRYARI